MSNKEKETPEVTDEVPAKKYDLKKIAKTAGAASAVILVGFGAYALGKNSDGADEAPEPEKTNPKPKKAE